MAIKSNILSDKRLKELERAEAKLSALDLINELSEIFGECAYEPSERGAGIAFEDEAFNAAMKLLSDRKVFFKNDLED